LKNSGKYLFSVTTEYLRPHTTATIARNKMYYTKLINEEHFAVGHSLVILLPHMEQHSSSDAVFYLIEKVHASVRWPILVFNDRYEMESNRFIGTHKHGNLDPVRIGRNIFQVSGSNS
jgi:hypothetical protein